MPKAKVCYNTPRVLYTNLYILYGTCSKLIFDLHSVDLHDIHEVATSGTHVDVEKHASIKINEKVHVDVLRK